MCEIASLVIDIAVINLNYIAAGKILIVLIDAHSTKCDASEHLHVFLDVYLMKISKRREALQLSFTARDRLTQPSRQLRFNKLLPVTTSEKFRFDFEARTEIRWRARFTRFQRRDFDTSRKRMVGRPVLTVWLLFKIKLRAVKPLLRNQSIFVMPLSIMSVRIIRPVFIIARLRSDLTNGFYEIRYLRHHIGIIVILSRKISHKTCFKIQFFADSILCTGSQSALPLNNIQAEIPSWFLQNTTIKTFKF